MKPSLQQEENLRTYLRKEMFYRETYEEVYDHVLTALEQKPQDVSFSNLVDQIIKDDFGGEEGLLEMEKKCYKLASDEANKQQWNYFKSSFKFPNLVYTLILFLTIYYSISKISFNPFILFFLIFVTVLVPTFFMLTRFFNIGYFTSDTKKSIKDKIMEQLGLKPMLFLNPCIMMLNFIPYSNSNKKLIINSWIIDYSFIVTIIISVIIVYIVSFIKLSKDEFKVYTTR